ncbi:MAG: hypothetical protein JSW39_23490 [Desulfobacterales bacterium]|nr:MAG: hypothetical protein JSW39_23490 [Desulfobacterales bacterium]
MALKEIESHARALLSANEKLDERSLAADRFYPRTIRSGGGGDQLRVFRALVVEGNRFFSSPSQGWIKNGPYILASAKSV